jgi:FKBP-type peptidyl-prolyl cis-trans isomerase FkpA
MNPITLLTACAVAATLILNPSHLMAQSNPSDNLALGQAFLKQNSIQPGVKTTPSGLQYKVVTEGHGKHPKATDTVLVHYRGTTIDGAEFDSSYKRNEPISFPLNGVIPGWTEGVQLMKEGGKIQLFIPSNLAYGSRGAGGVIPPDSTLIFDIELLKVQ